MSSHDDNITGMNKKESGNEDCTTQEDNDISSSHEGYGGNTNNNNINNDNNIEDQTDDQGTSSHYMEGYTPLNFNMNALAGSGMLLDDNSSDSDNDHANDRKDTSNIKITTPFWLFVTSLIAGYLASETFVFLIPGIMVTMTVIAFTTQQSTSLSSSSTTTTTTKSTTLTTTKINTALTVVVRTPGAPSPSAPAFVSTPHARALGAPR